MRKFLTLILAVISALTASADALGTAADSVCVYFRVGHRQFDPALGDNRAVMNDILAKIRQAAANKTLDSLVVCAYASPDGANAANVRLSSLRCDAIVNYLTSNADIPPGLIHSHPGGVAWSLLRNIVAADPDVPCREQILDIIDNTPVFVYGKDGRIIDGRKKRLMDLRGGRPYNWMLQHVFPRLRNAVVIMLYLTPDATPAVPATPAAPVTPVTSGTPAPSDTSTTPDSSNSSNLSDTSDTPSSSLPQKSTSEKHFALKTNLLYDAVLMPGLELEWLCAPRWSVAVEANCAWWKLKSRELTYRVASVFPEVRRWVYSDRPWHGLYVGAFGLGAKFDLANSHRGYQGHGVGGGISVGYMWPIARCWSLEAALGAGYMYSRYKEYRPFDGHYLYQRTKSLNYFGPLRAKLAIAWHFNLSN